MSAAPLSDARRYGGLLPGLLLTLLFGLFSVWLGQQPWFQARGLSALTLAILLGMLIGNTLYPRIAAPTLPGVGFAKQRLLRLGIILFGLRLTFQDIAQVGMAGVLIDALVLASTFLLAHAIGTRLFGLDRNTTILIGAGSAICGAAAVMATEPVVRGKAEQVTVAVSTVVVFGTLAMFLYPALYQWNLQHQWITLSPDAYGVFAGSTIHEVAQVVVAGRAVGEDAASAAVIAKMVRVMMLAPFLVILSAFLARRTASADPRRAVGSPAGGVVIPWFAFGFVAVAGFNSLDLLSRPVVDMLLALDTLLLAMAMFALGLTTHVSAIRNAGIRPLALAALLMAWLVGGGLAINLLLG